MFIVDSYTTSVLFCLLTMLCWGSWANTQKLTAGQWRFELFYWDYVIGIVLFSFLLAFTLGSNGTEGRSFLADWQQASMDNIMLAVLGGIMFNAANILLVAAIAIAGMSVAFPVGIGLALVIGVIVNYVEAPVGNAALVFGGVLLIVAAILLNAFAYRKLVTHVAGASTRGIVLSVVSGFQMGLFYRSVAISMFPDFNVPEAGKLSPYTAVVFFSLGIVLSNLLFNTLMMKFPFTGAPV
ncbi:MAG TPA: multidrug DMT transporter permease, partial [Cyclobacteriaceae bacterium]|nr:multidrug DMT transporter permease [Cyclobacteriaceae bacterium]